MLSAVIQLVSFVPNFFPVYMAQVPKPLRLSEAKKMDISLALKQEQYILPMYIRGSSSIPITYFRQN